MSTADGFFTKEWHIGGSYQKANQGSDTYNSTFQFQTPVTRRLWMGLDIPLYVNKGDKTEFGDLGFTLKTMFHETRNLSISGGVKTQFATGDRDTGGNVWAFKPHADFWSDVGHGWSVRGMFGAKFLPGSDHKPDSTIIANLAVGQTITPHTALLGDFTYFLSTNVSAPLGNRTNDNVTVSLTPGLRTHIVNNTFLVFGLDIPVTNPDPYDYQVNLLLVKGF